jgi:hypothetical protein
VAALVVAYGTLRTGGATTERWTVPASDAWSAVPVTVPTAPSGRTLPGAGGAGDGRSTSLDHRPGMRDALDLLAVRRAARPTQYLRRMVPVFDRTGPGVADRARRPTGPPTSDGSEELIPSGSSVARRAL